MEQNPPGKSNRKNPDYTIEGKYFDCYAPETGKVENIRTRLSAKVADDQADHLILNMADTSCTLDEIANLLERKPIENLKEILVVQDGHVIRFYPFGR